MLESPWPREYRLSPVGDGHGASCDTRGAFVGLIPLLRCTREGSGRVVWTPRPEAELNAVLSDQYGLPVDVAAKAGGLATIARALNSGEIALAQIATLHLQLPGLPPLSKSIPSAEDTARLAALLYKSGLLKGEWDPDKHPRTDEPPNPGWFAPVERQPRSDGAASGVAGSVGLVPIVDFSGGFHDAVVNAWVDFFKAHGIPAVVKPAIRIIGPDGRVIGYPDIIVHEPGQPIEVYEVKTGSDPPPTPNQRGYIPLLQYGRHIYSTDPRIRELGLEPGVPFPPVRVFVIIAPGPNQPYDVIMLPPPTIVP